VTGIVGDIYVQVVSGLQQGESVVLADYAEAVPSSNTTTTGGFGGPAEPVEPVEAGGVRGRSGSAGVVVVDGRTH